MQLRDSSLRERIHPSGPIKKHSRRSIRLPHYDYSQPGYYFITIVTNGRKMLFGSVKGGKMHLNRAGEFVETQWFAIGKDYEYC